MYLNPKWFLYSIFPRRQSSFSFIQIKSAVFVVIHSSTRVCASSCKRRRMLLNFRIYRQIQLNFIGNYRHFSSAQAEKYKIENILIIGAGVMGSGIAQACAIPGRLQSITLQDSSPKQVEKARKNILGNLTRLKAKRMINIENPEEIASRIQLTTELKPKTDENLLILETITEVLDWKRELFRQITDQFKDNETILFASNTSSFRIRDIAEVMSDSVRRRFAGLHFFDAVLMSLAEIGRTPWTSQATFDAFYQFTMDIDKIGIGCSDLEGLIVNRLQIPMIIEAVKMVERGDATVEEVDLAMRLGAGYPMGPFEEIDYIGVDTCRLILSKWTHPTGKVHESRLLNELVAAGNLGRKTGKGFYDYTKKKKSPES